ncbi:MAG: hypothetical protein IJW28_04980, partial [Clostridia bacterium]|nr:hypothetical protein [Clostridia bacterium]
AGGFIGYSSANNLRIEKSSIGYYEPNSYLPLSLNHLAYNNVYLDVTFGGYVGESTKPIVMENVMLGGIGINTGVVNASNRLVASTTSSTAVGGYWYIGSYVGLLSSTLSITTSVSASVANDEYEYSYQFVGKSSSALSSAVTTNAFYSMYNPDYTRKYAYSRESLNYEYSITAHTLNSLIPDMMTYGFDFETTWTNTNPLYTDVNGYLGFSPRMFASLQGSGTYIDPYLISSLKEFQLIPFYKTNSVSEEQVVFKQVSDIVFSNYYNEKYGTGALYSIDEFYDVYLGNHKAWILEQESNNKYDYVAIPLFKRVMNGALITDLNFQSLYTTYFTINEEIYNYMGGASSVAGNSLALLAASLEGGTIQNIRIENGDYVMGPSPYVVDNNIGVIIGAASGDFIVQNCIINNAASITSDYTGLLSTWSGWRNSSTSIRHAGILGYADNGVGIIRNSVCASRIILETLAYTYTAYFGLRFGGIVGEIGSNTAGTIVDSLLFSGNMTIGGIYGINRNYVGNTSIKYFSGIIGAVNTSGEGVILNNLISQVQALLTTYSGYASFNGNFRMSASFYATGSSILKEHANTYAFKSFYTSVSNKLSSVANITYAPGVANAEKIRIEEDSFVKTYEDILANDYLNAFEYDPNDFSIYMVIQTDKAFTTGVLDGDGTFSNPYKITSFYAMSLIPNYQGASKEEQKAFIQTRDITLFNYIDNTHDYNYNRATTIYIDNFYDVYYGQSYKINLADNNISKNDVIVNVFGSVESSSIIKDVNINAKSNIYNTNISSTDKFKELTGAEYASAFIGKLSGSIINITVNSGTFNLGTGSLDKNDYLGLIVGKAETGSIIRNANISNETTINFDINGYLADYSYTSNRESAEGIATYMGGIVGKSDGTIINSYVGASIVMDTGVGTDSSFNHTPTYMGGFVGKSTYSIDSCLFDGQMIITGSNALTTTYFGTTGNRKYFAGIAGDFECGTEYKGFNNVLSSIRSVTNTCTNLDLNNTSIFNLLKISAVSAMTSYNASQVYYNVASHYDFYKSLAASGITTTAWSANNSVSAESRIGGDTGCLYTNEQAFYNNLLLTDRNNYFVYTSDAIHLNIEFFNNRSIDEENYEEVLPTGKTYSISTPKQLNYISYISRSFDLSDDYFYGYTISISGTIDMAGYRWIPIQNFKGNISGSIKNLYIEQAADSICEYSGKYGIGFVGLSTNGHISNVTLNHACINAYTDPIFQDVDSYTWCVGGVVGISIVTGTYTHTVGSYSTINNCSINTTVNYIYNTDIPVVMNCGFVAGYMLAVEGVEIGHVVVTNYSGFNIMYERDENPDKLVTINAGILGTIVQSNVYFYECSVGYNQISGKIPMYLNVETTSNYNFKLRLGSYVGLAANAGVSISKSIMAGMNVLCGILNTSDWYVGSLIGHTNNTSASFSFSSVVILNAEDSAASGSYNYAYQYLGYYTDKTSISPSSTFAFYNGNLDFVCAGGHRRTFNGEYNENIDSLSSMIPTMAKSYNFLYEWQVGFGNFKTVYGDEDGLIGLYQFNPNA